MNTSFRLPMRRTKVFSKLGYFICLKLFMIINIIVRLHNVDATISDNFRRFLDERLGAGAGKLLAREDMGGGGSFGGGNHQARQTTATRPVILVHGITNTAGTFGTIQQHFLSRGYKDEEVYGTTYGNGANPGVLLEEMHCHYVKMIRMLIEAVADYTNSKVSVIGYSMGSPIARKAIKGGICVETNEQLGPPLTGLIDTYIGVAGANFGSFLCFLPVGSCNSVNGMSCGSKYLRDINSAHRYEGSHIYTIYSNGDDKVGYFACGRKASSIIGEDQAFEQSGLNHDGAMYDTASLQYSLVTFHKP